tara:strand:- start:271 stop:951 length:681 start_codon:yes stop_codon:yes gene_type:complete
MNQTSSHFVSAPPSDNSFGLVNRLMGNLRAQEKQLSRSHWSLISKFLTFANHAEKTIAEQQQRIALLESLAQTDELTGLLNRRGFDRALERAIARVQRHKEASVLLYIDINHFKTINDRFGHNVGDEVLCHVATRLALMTRKTDHIGRLGGDEFAILLNHCDMQGAKSRIRHLKDGLATSPINIETTPLLITVSIGMADLNASFTMKKHYRLADEDMYRDKQSQKS